MNIAVPAGIGDSVWLIQKLINTNEKFKVFIHDGFPQRGAQIWELCPQVTESCHYVPGLFYEVRGCGYHLKDLNIAKRGTTWKSIINHPDVIRDKGFCIEANTHVESGSRIENFLPDLPTSFKIDWASHHEKASAKKLLGKGKFIGIYGSSYSTARHWDMWQVGEWIELIKLIHAKDPDYIFVIIGASWDLDLTGQLIPELDRLNIKYVNVIGKNLAFSLEVMKLLKYMFAFPSGLGIVAPTISVPCVMFIAPQIKTQVALMNTFASPEDLKADNYKACLRCSPKVIFDWCVQNNKI